MTFALIFHADTRNKFPTSNSKISSAKWGKTQFVTFKQKRTTAKRHVLLHAYELYADGCCCCCWLLDIPRIRRHLFLFGISNELHWHWRHCDTTFNSLPPPFPSPSPPWQALQTARIKDRIAHGICATCAAFTFHFSGIPKLFLSLSLTLSLFVLGSIAQHKNRLMERQNVARSTAVLQLPRPLDHSAGWRVL